MNLPRGKWNIRFYIDVLVEDIQLTVVEGRVALRHIDGNKTLVISIECQFYKSDHNYLILHQDYLIDAELVRVCSGGYKPITGP